MSICICISESLCCTPETNSFVDQLYSQKKKKKKQEESLKIKPQKTQELLSIRL